MSVYDKASLVLIPSGTKTSKVYSQKPVNGDGDFTFSRSTAATRVNADGNIEKETQNLLLQSNDFDTSWDKVGVSLTSGQSGYDGTNDAWLLTKTAVSYERVRQNNTSSGVLTASVYAKANTLNQATIYCFTSVSNAYAKFSLVDGSVVLSNAIIDSNAISIGNGWWRLSITFNDTLQSLNIYPDLAESNAGSIYIQDAQVEQGLVARDYIETTTAAVEGGITDNVPRLDYTDSSCPALLLEPLRTNLETQSEYIAGWSNISNVTRTANYEESPEGVDNATRLEFTANGYTYNGNSPSQVNGSTYTLSCYAKRNDSGTQNFGFFRDGSGAVDSAMALTSEWKRFEYTYTATNPSRLGLAGQSGADVSVYGFQIEKDATYATSYIPTYGTSVTRNRDVSYKTNTLDLLGQTEGTIFLDFIYGANSNTNVIFQIRRMTGVSKQIDIRIQSDILRALGNSGGTGQFDMQYGALNEGTRYKCAVRYQDNNSAFYVNGTLASTDTDCDFAVGQLAQISFAENLSALIEKQYIRQALVFKTALSNEELAALTTI